MSVQIKIAMKELDVEVSVGAGTNVSYKGSYNLNLNMDDIPAVLAYLKALGKQIEAAVKDEPKPAIPVDNAGSDGKTTC
jgi:hypothetical protein